MEFSKLEDFILEKMRQTKMPALSIALIQDGQIVYKRGFGFRVLETYAPADENTVYGVGSITKSFTALAIVKLAEEGKIDLEKPVEEYLPIKLRPFGEPVRVKHLLYHASGIPSLGYAEAFIDGAFGLGDGWLPVKDPQDVLLFAKDAESWAFTKPNERFFYSNSGYVMLGKIVSTVTGMSYEEYVKRYILEPLGMTRSYFSRDEVEKDPNVAAGYVLDPQGHHVRKPFPYGISSDGGLLSNVMDLSRYLIFYMNGGEFEGKRIVSKRSIETMVTGHIPAPWESFGDETYGYGWIVHPNFLGERLIEHSGSVLIYTGFVGYVPERKIAVAVLSNCAGYPLSNIGMYALALMLDKDPEESLEFVRSDRVLQSLVGRYEGYRKSVAFDVKRSGEFLIMEMVSRNLKLSSILVPEKVEKDYVKCFTLQNFRKMDVEFFIEPNRIVLLYERYKLIKS
ncbi:serine hydrolase [Thermotoga caldifontis]|uniref:serine hydrolase n=1 Tax=Thermotoga caldifontis TaxID=1508419 RepID=UPI0005972241|nr:serine hydrolase [Thermotoga caldifontis]